MTPRQILAGAGVAAAAIVGFSGSSTEAPAAAPVPAAQVRPASADTPRVAPAEKKTPAPAPAAKSNCHPSYSGCLRADASDYDCAGGSGNGPYYTGAVQVYGSDPFGLDRDGDGWGCE